MILGWLIKNNWVLIISAFAISIAFGSLQTLEKSICQKRLAERSQEISSLNTMLAQQNASIIELETQSRTLENKISQAEKTANKAQQVADLKIQKILSAHVPNDCEGAISWGIKQLQGTS